MSGQYKNPHTYKLGCFQSDKAVWSLTGSGRCPLRAYFQLPLPDNLWAKQGKAMQIKAIKSKHLLETYLRI